MSDPIKTTDLPRALALAMLWTIHYQEPNGWVSIVKDGHKAIRYFQPHQSHDHADICIRECKRKGVIESYLHELAGECGAWDEGDNYRFDLMVLATPEQKSRAALIVLTSSN